MNRAAKPLPNSCGHCCLRANSRLGLATVISYGRFVGKIVIRLPHGQVRVNETMQRLLPTTPTPTSGPLPESTPQARTSDPSCSSTETGWVTVGPCVRGSLGYDSQYDADGDGVSCEGGCHFYRPALTPPPAVPVTAPKVSDTSCSSTQTGWVTVGPCYRGSVGYQAQYDADGDGVSCEHGCSFYRRPPTTTPSPSYTPSSSTSRNTGGWVTIGPCHRGQSCYSSRGDGDNDGISCERGCRVWRRN